MVFDETGILNRALQDRTTNMTTALDEAGLTIQALIEKKNNPETFKSIINTINKFAEDNDIQEPSTYNQRGRKANELKR